MLGAHLVIPIDSTKFPDGTYRFRAVGYQDDGAGGVKNGHVLLVCGTDFQNEWWLTFDNAVPDNTVPDCGAPHIRVCTREPLAMLNSITINGAPIPPCGVTEIDGNLEIDFEASDADGHLAGFDLSLHYGAGIVQPLLPLGVLTNISADYLGETYAKALVQGATRPTWNGGRMLLTVPAKVAFPVPCCYLIRLEVRKRHVFGSGGLGSCSYNCTFDQYYNLDEFTVGAGVCDPVRRIELPSAAQVAARVGRRLMEKPRRER